MTGILAATLVGAALWLLFATVALAVVGLVARHRASGSAGSNSPVATFLIGLTVLSASWIAVRGPARLPLSDLPLLLALPLLGGAALAGRKVLPLPPWLVCVGGGLAVAAILPAIFILDRPPRVLGEQSVLTIGAAASRDSDLALLMRMEYAFIIVPVAIGTVTGSWGRARLFADLWLASTVICVGVGIIDHLAGTNIVDTVAKIGPGEPVPGGRIRGLTIHPNYLGFFAAMAIPLGVTRSVQTSGITRLVPVAATAALALGIQLSGSRLAVVTAILGVGFVIVLVPRFRTRAVMAIVACVAVAIVGFLAAPSNQATLHRLVGDPSTEQATSERFRVIGEALHNGVNHPLTGIGFDRILDSHSVPVQFLQAGGIVALASLVLWAVCFGTLGARLARNPQIPRPSAELAAALMAGLMGWLLGGILAPQVVERFIYVPAGILLGLGMAAARSRVESEFSNVDSAIPDPVKLAHDRSPVLAATTSSS